MRERILTVLDLNGKPQSPAPCGGLVFPSGLQSSPMEFARTPNGDWEIRIFSQTSWAGEAWNVSTWERAADGVYLYAGTVVKD